MSELEKFLEERSIFQIPPGLVAQVKLLAKELAMGYDRGMWKYVGHWTGSGAPHCRNANLETFFRERWSIRTYHEHVDNLLQHGYTFKDGQYENLADKAIALIDEVEPYNIFISYRRLDSSALALLVLARLKEHGLIPFVDMALEAGGNWHADLEEMIKDNDYFIILLGKDTLSSPMTMKEIEWALRYERTIIPIWHSGFDIRDKKWKDVSDEVLNAIQQINAIRVTDESASGYNSAIVELLNRFSFTP